MGWPYYFGQGVGGGRGGGSPERGEYGVAMECPNFEFLLGIGLNLGCILKLGWPWGGLGHPTPHPVHPVHHIGDIYYAFAPKLERI